MKKIIVLILALFTITIVANAQVELVSNGISGFYDVTVPGTFVLTNGLQVTFKAHATFDASSKLNVSLSGGRNITKLGGSVNITGTDILSGQIVTVAYDGTTWQMISASSFTPPPPANYWSPSGTDIYNNTGNVGIGINTPANLLHVNDPSNTQGTLQITAGTGTGTSSLDGLLINSNSVGSSILNRENTPLYFGTNSVNRMSILANGNVGIGVTPAQPLEVATSTQSTTAKFANTFNGASNTAVYGWTTGAGTGTNYGGSFESSGSPTNYGVYGNAYGTNSNYGGYFTAGSGANNYGTYSIATAAGTSNATSQYSSAAGSGTGTTYGVYGQNSSSVTGATYAGYFQNMNSTGSIIFGVRTQLTGNSGTGGTKYGIQSEVTGSAPANYAGYFSATGGTTNYAIVVPAGGGSVGIGTLTPQNKLHIDGGAAITYAQFTNNTTGQTAADGLMVGLNGAGAAFISYWEPNDFKIQTNGINALWIAQNGNIGLGTAAAPTAKLEVNGVFKLTDGTQAVDKVLTSDASGNASWKGSINFSANASSTSIPSGTMTTLTYINAEYNNGGAYNSATGVFTAPISGIYHFDASVAIPATSSWPCQIQILRNGGTHKIAYGNYIPVEGVTFATISVDIYLPVSNTVAIGVYQGSIGAVTPTGSQAVFFTGHLIR